MLPIDLKAEKSHHEFNEGMAEEDSGPWEQNCGSVEGFTQELVGSPGQSRGRGDGMAEELVGAEKCCCGTAAAGRHDGELSKGDGGDGCGGWIGGAREEEEMGSKRYTRTGSLGIKKTSYDARCYGNFICLSSH